MIYFIFLLFGKIMIFAPEEDQEAILYQLCNAGCGSCKKSAKRFYKADKARQSGKAAHSNPGPYPVKQLLLKLNGDERSIHGIRNKNQE